MTQECAIPSIPYYIRLFALCNYIFTEMFPFCHWIGGKFLAIAGIITEYNPLHTGHVHLLEETRRALGADTAIVCVMSGDFVQRGDFALVRRQARARAAVLSGADLVLELPLPWAVSSAERFAQGGVRTLLATGLVTHLAFGSECGDAQALERVAAALLSDPFTERLRQELTAGASFAASRQRAVAALLDDKDAALLESPNNTLGVEYVKALLREGSAVNLFTIPRSGAAHDAHPEAGQHASASSIRMLLREGQEREALDLMAPAMGVLYREEEAAGRAPVFGETCERAMLYRLRMMDEGDLARLDEGREGLYRRLYQASRTASSVEEVLEQAKTKRYAYARLRRMVLWAYLGLDPHTFPQQPPYLRPLAANKTGRELLARMKTTASVPVLTKPADVRRLSREAQDLFAMEARAVDLYTLAYPQLSASQGGSAWRENPVMV